MKFINQDQANRESEAHEGRQKAIHNHCIMDNMHYGHTQAGAL